MVYLKCRSYDKELNNKCHTNGSFYQKNYFIFMIYFLIYTYYQNNFKSFN